MQEKILRFKVLKPICRSSINFVVHPNVVVILKGWGDNGYTCMEDYDYGILARDLYKRDDGMVGVIMFGMVKRSCVIVVFGGITMRKLTVEEMNMVNGGQKWAQCLMPIGKYKGKSVACGKIFYGAFQWIADYKVFEHQCKVVHEADAILG